MIHIAVLLRPYVELIQSGEKTVECRLTKHARPPYNAVEPGDRIYFKVSAGPWRLTALVEQALFEADLTPKRVREIRRDYNDVICGDARYWQGKKDARYLTLVWLRDVEPISTGPGIRPLQGAAWMTLPRGNSWGGECGRPARAKFPAAGTAALPLNGSPPATAARPDAGLSFAIPITAGNLRNSSLSVSSVLERFPPWCMGGPNRREQARPVTLVLRDGPVVETDIVLARKLFRARPWKRWFEAVGAKAGDEVVFTPIDDATWFVGHNRLGKSP